MEMVEISDPEISKCTIDDIMKEQPPFVVVSCCGENLGEEKSCINQLLVGTRTHLFIFKLKKKSLMDEGHLRQLLLDIHIKKVFFRIAEVSPSLINEYDILLNGVPLWDIEILYDKLLGQMPAREIEMIKEMGFHRKMFKKWSRKCQNSSSELEDPEEFKQQARMMYKMFLLFEKSLSDIYKRILKKEAFEKAMPAGDDHFLAEKVKLLRLEQKMQNEQLKKKKAENNPHSAAAGGKTVGKGTAGGHSKKKDSEEPEMEMVEISDPIISELTIDNIMKEHPPFVVVRCCGENLGEENSCINQLLVGTRTHLFIFNLEKKSLMDEGHLRTLLLDTHIKKVFFRIGEVSPSLINEYDILLTGVPIWDIEILHDNLSGQFPAIEKEFIIKEMGSSFEVEDPEELKQQARMMYKMFTLFEKRFENVSDINKRVLKRDLYEKAMLAGDDHFLAEKVKLLRLEQKMQKGKLKKQKAEHNRSMNTFFRAFWK